jgi:hypothetical protein
MEQGIDHLVTGKGKSAYALEQAQCCSTLGRGKEGTLRCKEGERELEGHIEDPEAVAIAGG